MQRIKLIIEKGDIGYFGRAHFEDNLIVESADDILVLEQKMKDLLHSFHDLDPEYITFEKVIDLSALFEIFDVLKISVVAKMAGINESLFRQYIMKKKHPSIQRAQKIEEIIRAIGARLSTVHVLAE